MASRSRDPTTVVSALKWPKFFGRCRRRGRSGCRRADRRRSDRPRRSRRLPSRSVRRRCRVRRARNRPAICGASRAPGVFRPSVVAGFAGMRNRVERPAELARANVEGTDVAPRRRRHLDGPEADDDEIHVDDAGRGHRQNSRAGSSPSSRVACSSTAPSTPKLAIGRRSPDRVHSTFSMPANSRALPSNRRVETAPGRASGVHARIEPPLLPARRRVQSHDVHRGRERE